MAKNVSLWGAVYSGTTAIDVPVQGGGTARFTDTSPTTAIDSDVASGKVYFKADGSQSTGTASGGGGNYQEKTVTPTTSTQIITADSGGSTTIESGVALTVNTRTTTATTSHTWLMVSGETYHITQASGQINGSAVTIDTDIVWSPPVTLSYTGGNGLSSIVLTSTGATITYTYSGDNYGTLSLNITQATQGYDALSQVTVNPIPSEYIIPTGTISISQNGTVDVSAYASALVSVSGGSGLEYETGTYTPTSDTHQPTISFANTHTKTPIIVYLTDATGTTNTQTYTQWAFGYIDFSNANFNGYPITQASATVIYGYVYFVYRPNSSSSFTQTTTRLTYPSSNTDNSSTSYPRYWVTNTGFKPTTTSASTYFRTGRTYKWIAIWK